MLINKKLFDELSSQAADNERLRVNFNLHTSLDDHVQRLFNALEPGTVLPVHRHKNTAETYIVLRGRLEVLMYNENGNLTETVDIYPDKGNYGMHIEAGQWHTINVLEKGTIIFEVKQGPYKPLDEDEIMQL
jgi:cupin fold WbuC family metalloprotein